MPVGVSDDDLTKAGDAVADPLSGDSLSYPDWLQLRNAQVAGRADDAGDDVRSDQPSEAPASAPTMAEDDGLPLSYDPDAGRFKVLSRFEAPADADQISSGIGDDTLMGGAGADALRQTVQGPLTGSTPISRAVADAVDHIVSAPNTSAKIHLDAVNGELQRGPGQDVHARGRVRFVPFQPSAEGVLSQPNGQAGVTISNIKGKGLGLPSQVRLYNLPNGELDAELKGSVTFGPKTLFKPGRYVIP